MILAPQVLQSLIIAGATLTVLTGGWALVKSFFSVYNAVRDTHKTVTLLAENHLPHIQESLNNQDVSIHKIEQYGKEVSANVKTVELRLNDHIVRFDDTKKSVDRINDIFLTQASESIRRTNAQASLEGERVERVAQRKEENDAANEEARKA